MGEMTEETPLHLLSQAVECLTVVIEHPSSTLDVRDWCEQARSWTEKAVWEWKAVEAFAKEDAA